MFHFPAAFQIPIHDVISLSSHWLHGTCSTSRCFFNRSSKDVVKEETEKDFNRQDVYIEDITCGATGDMITCCVADAWDFFATEKHMPNDGCSCAPTGNELSPQVGTSPWLKSCTRGGCVG